MYFPPKITQIQPLKAYSPSTLSIQVLSRQMGSGCVIYEDGTANLFEMRNQVERIPLDEDKQVAAVLVPIREASVTHERDHAVTRYDLSYIYGDCTFVPSRPPSEEKIQEGIATYAQTKMDILKTNISLIIIGASLEYHISSSHNVVPFVIGGITGVLYQRFIQMEIDQIGSEHKNIMYQLLGNSFFRLSFISSIFMLASMKQTGSTVEIQTYAEIITGFMLNKIAMYITFWKNKK